MKSQSAKQILIASTLFGDAAATSLERIAARARVIEAPPGRMIVNAGDANTHIYLVAEGAIKLAITNIAGNEKIIATLDDGKCFGLAEYFSGRAFHYYAEALTPARIVSVPGSVIMATGHDDGAVYLALLRALGRHFDALADEIENSSRYSGFQRVVHALLARAERRSDGTVEVRLPGKKSHMASRLGVAAETLSRSLATLTEQGIVGVDNRVITLHDIDALQAILEPPDSP